MIVLGADMQKRSHTIAAIAATTGELLGDKTIDVGARGFAAGHLFLDAKVETVAKARIDRRKNRRFPCEAPWTARARGSDVELGLGEHAHGHGTQRCPEL